MKLDCNACGMPARPYDAACRGCGARVQDDAAAAAKRAEWDAAPAAVVRDLEANLASIEREYAEYLDWMRRHRRAQAITASLCFTFLASFGNCFILSWILLPLDVAAGAWLGLDLNARRGGQFLGLTRFGAAYLGSTLLKILLFGPGTYLQMTGASLGSALVVITFWSGGMIGSTVFGGILGMKLEYDHDGRH